MTDQLPEATGDCYQIVWSVAAQLELLGGGNVRIIHGIPTGKGPIEGIRFGHAWVEVDVLTDDGETKRCAVDMSNGLPLRFIDVDTWNRYGQIDPDENVEYTIGEFRDLALSTGHFGPWTEAHLAVA